MNKVRYLHTYSTKCEIMMSNKSIDDGITEPR